MFKLARVKKSWVIAKIKKKAYCEFREEAYSSSKKPWKAVKKAKNRVSRQSCLSSIQKSMKGLATEFVKKIKELKKVLLPILQSVDLSNIQDFKYSNRLEIPKITENEILETIKHFWTWNAFGPNQISNEVLKVIIFEICSYLQ